MLPQFLFCTVSLWQLELPLLETGKLHHEASHCVCCVLHPVSVLGPGSHMGSAGNGEEKGGLSAQDDQPFLVLEGLLCNVLPIPYPIPPNILAPTPATIY